MKSSASTTRGFTPRGRLRFAAAGAVGREKKIYIACGFIALLSIGTIIAMSILYIRQKEVERPHETPLEQLKSTLAEALRRPDLEFGGAKKIAEEVKNLPINIKIAQSVYSERKKKYYDLFHKVLRSSSGPWKLHGRSLYYFSKEEKSWYDAENFCVSRDAHLASILNEEEQNFISSQLQHASWIGLTGEKEGAWGWSDGTRLVTQYWSDGKPSNVEFFAESSQDCTLTAPSLTAHNWYDENCHKRYRWICKENLDLSET